MEPNRPDITNTVLANYDAIVRRAHEERSKYMAGVLAGVAPFVWRCGEKAVGYVASVFRAKSRNA